MTTKKKNRPSPSRKPAPVPPQLTSEVEHQKEPVNTCASRVLERPPDSTAVALTKEIQENLWQINAARSEISDLNERLAYQKDRLSEGLINHAHNSRRLDDVLRVSQPIGP